ncbi:Protein ANTAGONIST OF LIKE HETEROCHROMATIN PROTEIN 1 [Frankliniella fusca]|uniref:Protein ANTAGONIST OF LIKE HETEROCHROMATIN PROTEIN 1 n=1 Tax=Frankliniella fusca TaxID=407009 RepID=A0AAE1L8H0_9NEOP|nr:Protein ANTAGONIST OF LIKE HETEROCHROMATIN PROTEIN 1 [Frankliniella fusca]
MTLYWLAAGMSFRVLGNTFDVCRSVAFDVTSYILDEICLLMRHVIKLPEEAELPHIGNRFAEMADSPAFSQCCGALDGCQVYFICDDAERHDEYINRKLYYSINLTGLVDHMGRFIDVCIGFPGSCHDMRVLRHSGLFRAGVYPPRGYFIIGDGGYQCLRKPITLITPYRNVNLTPDQLSFNFHLSKARSVVERTFGLLQARFRVMYHRALEVKFPKAVKVITAACVLHNICIDAEDFVDYTVHPRRGQQILRLRNEEAGEAYRNILCLAHNVGRRQALLERQLD